jgi:hypothetical protein
MIRLLSQIHASTVHAVDGDIGTVTDCFLSEDLARVRYLVLDAGNWNPGGRALVSVSWVQDVTEAAVALTVTREQIKRGPMLDVPPTKPEVTLDQEGGRLRSAKQVAGCHLQASDEAVGHVDDFLVDPATWAIGGLLIDTSNAPGGKWVTLAPELVSRIDWIARKVFTRVTADRVRNSPEYREQATNPTV